MIVLIRIIPSVCFFIMLCESCFVKMGKDGEGQPGLGAIGTSYSIPSPRFPLSRSDAALDPFPPRKSSPFALCAKCNPTPTVVALSEAFFSEADGGGEGRVAQGIVV